MTTGTLIIVMLHNYRPIWQRWWTIDRTAVVNVGLCRPIGNEVS